LVWDSGFAMNRTEFEAFAPDALQATWLTELLAMVESAAREHLLAEGFSVRGALDETLTSDGTWYRRLFGLTVTGPDDLAMDVVARVNIRWPDGRPRPGCWLRLSARIYSQQQADDEFRPGWELLDWAVLNAPLDLTGLSNEQAHRAFITSMEEGLGPNPVPELRELTQEFCRQTLEAIAP
jgi:hypothetical protein